VTDSTDQSNQNPAPPKELATAMRSAVENKENPTAVEILEAAERLLDNVLRSDCETRASALHLLTVDALMTQALHVANEDTDVLADFAEEAMRRIASYSPQPEAAPPNAPGR
jgi:hypothetical protein